MLKPKVLFIVATQYDNLGDLLINKCLLNELVKHSTVYLDSRGVPEEFKKQLLSNSNNIIDLENLSLTYKGLHIFNIIFKSQDFDYIFKSPGPFGGNSNFKDLSINLAFITLFGLAKIRKIKPYLIGIDLSIENKIDRIINYLFSKVTNKIKVRSKVNYQNLKKTGIKNIGYIPDLCFQLSGLENRYNDKIGVSFRDLNLPFYEKNILKSLSEFLDFFKDEDKKIEFFYQVDRDKYFTKKLFDNFKNYKNVTFREEVLKWEDKSYYSDFEYVVSNRLHVLLLGQVHGCLPIGVLTDHIKTNKIIRVFNALNQSSLITENIDFDFLENIINDKNDYHLLLKENNNNQSSILSDEIAILFK